MSAEVLTVLSRCVRDAAWVVDCRAEAITANTFDTQSGFDNNCESSSASGKPLACSNAKDNV